MMTKILAIVAIALLPIVTFAEEVEAPHEGGVPMVLILQAINFIMYAGLVIYFMRTPVREYFSGRKEKFNTALNRAAAAKAEAEARKQEMQNRINDLQRSSAQELARAKSEAAELQTRILKDAEEISAHLKSEANRSATYEIERAKNELRESLLSQAVAFSSQLLKEKMVEGDQKRLSTEFVDKIGANR